MDKITIKFFADLLYIKGTICFDEFNAIMKASSMEDLGVIVEKMLCEEYNVLIGQKKPKREVVYDE